MDTHSAIRFSKVLVVNDSTVLREMLRLVLGAHSGEVLTARDLREGENKVARHCDLDLVVTDVSLPDGDGFDLLKRISLLEDPKPRVIFITGHPVEEEERRASEMGAIGYLGKPISFRDIASVLHRRGGGWNNQRKPRRRTSGRACLLEKNGSVDTDKPAPLFWYIRDVSASGAFLETESPIPVGTKLELDLEIEGAKLRVQAQVVRVQEPNWGCVAGVGVHFTQLAGEDRKWIEDHVAAGICEAW